MHGVSFDALKCGILIGRDATVRDVASRSCLYARYMRPPFRPSLLFDASCAPHVPTNNIRTLNFKFGVHHRHFSPALPPAVTLTPAAPTSHSHRRERSSYRGTVAAVVVPYKQSGS